MGRWDCPLLVAYVTLLVVCWRTLRFETTDPTYEVARVTARGVIGFMAVFNIIDPHLSLRGGADLMFVLVPLAFAFTPLARPASRRSNALNLVEARDHRAISAHARIQIGEIGGLTAAHASGWPIGVDRRRATTGASTSRCEIAASRSAKPGSTSRPRAPTWLA